MIYQERLQSLVGKDAAYVEQLDPPCVLGILDCETLQIRFHKEPENSKIGLSGKMVPPNLTDYHHLPVLNYTVPMTIE